MGRNYYNGGHTIIRADGSFGSYDPAEITHETVKTNNPPNGIHKKSSESAKKRVNAKKPLSLSEQRKTLLNMAADARVSNKKLGLKFPKSIKEDLQQEVTRVGSIDAWGPLQIGFSDMVRKKIQKKTLKEKLTSRSEKSDWVEVIKNDSAPTQASRIDIDRIAFLKDEIAEAEQFIRVAKKEITFLQRRLGVT